jgi:hypothetical protein
MLKTLKLYRVETQGMTSSFIGSTAHGVAYVVAIDPSEAYEKLRAYLDEHNFGLSKERELKSITLIAEAGTDYAACGYRLFL